MEREDCTSAADDNDETDRLRRTEELLDAAEGTIAMRDGLPYKRKQE